MAEERVALTGAVTMTVTSPDGEVLASVMGRNRVTRLGRNLAAASLAGLSAPPTFRILLGASDAASEDDDLRALLKPIPDTHYTADTQAPAPTVDPKNAQFRLVTTFTAKEEMAVGESGIQIDRVVQERLPTGILHESPPEALGGRVIAGLGETPGPLGEVITRPLGKDSTLYNRALVTPPVALRAGDKLSVTWTVSFVSA